MDPNDLQNCKKLVWNFHQKLDTSSVYKIADVISEHTHTNHIWRGYYPFNEIQGAQEIAEIFWIPLRNAMDHMQRRVDIFFAGQNEIDDFNSTWVVSMGNLMGLFDNAWLGLQPTGKMAFLRYCEFNKIEDGKIVETAMYFDVPHFMVQANYNPFPKATAAHLVQPGPMPHNGLLFDQQDPNEGKKTLDLINSMISDLGQWNSGMKLEDELRRTWCEDMIWWGPTGIGATFTIERYAKQHSGPFRNAFSERSKTNHICRLSEGHFGGFFGWPNFTAKLTDEFMGFPATNKVSEFRVIDIYRRSQNRLAENWIFIDLLHFWKQQGLDILDQMANGESFK
ncbi:MAG: ester cyclase [Paracoccaceae bacterium]